MKMNVARHFRTFFLQTTISLFSFIQNVQFSCSFSHFALHSQENCTLAQEIRKAKITDDAENAFKKHFFLKKWNLSQD